MPSCSHKALIAPLSLIVQLTNDQNQTGSSRPTHSGHQRLIFHFQKCSSLWSNTIVLWNYASIKDVRLSCWKKKWKDDEDWRVRMCPAAKKAWLGTRDSVKELKRKKNNVEATNCWHLPGAVWSCQNNYNEVGGGGEGGCSKLNRCECVTILLRDEKKSAGCWGMCQLNSLGDYLFNATKRCRSIENDQS